MMRVRMEGAHKMSSPAGKKPGTLLKESSKLSPKLDMDKKDLNETQPAVVLKSRADK